MDVQKIQLALDGSAPRVLMARRSVLGRAWSQSREKTDPHGRIYHVESGRAWASIDGGRVELLPGVVCLVPADTPFAYGCPRRVVINWAHFTLTTGDGVDFFRLFRCPWWLKADDEARTREAHERLRLSDADNSPAGEFERRAWLYLLLAPFMARAESVGTVGGRSLARLRPVLEHIERHVSSGVDLRTLSKVAGMAPGSFSRFFTQCMGTGPARYMMARRVRAAQRLLRQTDRKLDDIAGELGFSDAFHFSKTFKRLVGASPRDYRRSGAAVVP